jgi:mono/diheme cytochrome c family protein
MGAAALVFPAACSYSFGFEDTLSDGGGPTAEGGAPQQIENGEKIYGAECAVCHGPAGAGTDAGVSLLDDLQMTPAALAAKIIAENMPLPTPGNSFGQCTNSDQCANNVAAYILTFGAPASTCNGSAYPARVVRLLSEREYLATVNDLLNPGAPAADDAGASCSPAATFSFTPPGSPPQAVVVASNLNGWATSASTGAWPLSLGANGTWSGAAPAGALSALDGGLSFEYKFVADGNTWYVDPNDPNTASDGNSVYMIGCVPGQGATPAADGGTSWPAGAATYPAEVPAATLFDDEADREVDLVHIQAWWSAAPLYAAAANMAPLLTCDYTSDPSGCATTFVTSFGLRAFRRPLLPNEITEYTTILHTHDPDFLSGARLVVRAMLMSPNFLYRTEAGAEADGGAFDLTPYETASELSYMLWGTMPDQALFDAAGSGALTAPADLKAQATRMLHDPRAQNMISTFGTEWLQVENLPGQSGLPAALTADLRQQMIEETALFFSYVVLDSGTSTYDELLTAQYTFANQTLAALYGISGVTGDFQKVNYADMNRSGVLGQGAWLANSAFESDKTSPIHRGMYARSSFLCQVLQRPSGVINPVTTPDASASIRVQLDEHVGPSGGSCATCHTDLDGIGLGFLNFDQTGQWRTQDPIDNSPIDPRGWVTDLDVTNVSDGPEAGVPFSSLPELAKILTGSNAGPSCFVQQYYSFVHGTSACANQLSPHVATFQANGRDVQQLIFDLVTSSDFVVRQ